VKTYAPCLLATAVALTAAACTIDVQGQERVVREQKRITVTGPLNLNIRTFDGLIELRSWDRPEVLVDIERRATNDDVRDLEVRTTENNGFITIEAVRHHRRDRLIHLGRWGSSSVRLRVTAPRELTVEARSGDGAILARDLSGRIDLQTGDGSVRLQQVAGEINVRTGDGTVTASDVGGAVMLQTGDGSVDISGRLDAVNVRSGDGSVRIDARPGSMMRREWSVTSGDGPVSVRLPADFNANLDAHTGDGAISAVGVMSTDPVELRRRDRRRGVLRGKIGSGGETLLVRTGDGPIVVVAK
jgi:hypothetical protein